jgi:hypothetical protein
VFERFTDQSRRVLVLAQEEARLLDHSFIGTEHLLLGLMQEGVAAQVLAGCDISLSAVREQAVRTIGLSGISPTGFPPFTPRAKKVLELSLRSALQLGDEEIGPEHILLGLIQEGQGVGAQILVHLGAELADIRQRVIQLLSESQGGLGDRLSYHPELPPELRRQTSNPTFGTPRLWHQGKLVICSFCGASPPESGQLIAGTDAFICEQCVRRWSQRLNPVRSSQTHGWQSESSAAIPAGPEPDDADAARAQIRAAFAASNTASDDGQSVATVEKGENLGPTLAAANEQGRGVVPEGKKATLTVDEIEFYDIQRAAVWFSISIDQRRLLSRHRGEAVLVAGQWKMARSTFCQLMALAGISCPPETG